ncbi:hypothetical protein DVH24_033662 [Malus domestica]|uniref:Uncharacterized protein n=1 Tax=Malus domestica TaxID=3750 RepID=A0A498HPA0_MALDO|nr:hypothetical protein DVH24_033662 [Malus domestica]
MITVIRLSRPQPPGLIFMPTLPSNFSRKATGVRFKQGASVHISSENSNMDKQQDEPTLKTSSAQTDRDKDAVESKRKKENEKEKG